MKFTHDDGGRAAAGFKGSAGDCVARAVAIASGRPYAQVYKELAALERARGKARSARNGVKVQSPAFREYMRALGFTWVSTMGIGTGCRVHLTEKELPAGRLVVRISKHCAAVIDGTLRDTFNCAERGATIYPRNTLENIPAGAYLRDDGRYWIYKPLRCVYGYWRKE